MLTESFYNSFHCQVRKLSLYF